MTAGQLKRDTDALRAAARDLRDTLPCLSLTPAERVSAHEACDFIEAACNSLTGVAKALKRRQQLSKALARKAH